MMASWVSRAVDVATRRRFLVLLISLGVTAAAMVYAARNFALTADTAELISTGHIWRQRELAYERAFPSLQRLTIVEIDGATPELAEDAASRLSPVLARQTALFRLVRRPDAEPFFGMARQSSRSFSGCSQVSRIRSTGRQRACRHSSRGRPS